MKPFLTSVSVAGIAAALVSFSLFAAAPAHSESVAQTAPDDALPRLQLVLDSSGSMDEPAGGGKKRIEAAKDALRQVVAKLPEEQEVGMRVFGLDPDVAENDPASCKDSKLAVKVGTENRDKLRSAIDEYKPAGWTPTGFALQEAAKDLGESGSRSIVLVSDGESNCDPEPCKVAEDLSKQGINVRIDVVGLNVKGSARKQLQCIAENGGGKYVDAQDAAGIVRGVTETVSRASRPFDLTGDPIEGATTIDAAPEITTGQYLDKVPQTGTIYYRVKRSAPGSTIHVGIINENHKDWNYSNSVDIGVSVRDAQDSDDGLTSCASDTGSWRNIRTAGNPLGYAATSSWDTDPQSSCVTAEEIIVSISARDSSGSSTGLPIEIGVYEEPPPADKTGRSLNPAPAAPTWATLESSSPTAPDAPGTSLASAPVIEDGSYDLNINLGETQVFAVPLDWGQSIQAQLDATVSQQVRDAVGYNDEIVVDVISPLRGNASVDFDEPDDWTDTFDGLRSETTYRTGAMSYAIGYLNRASSEAVAASLPGLHYVRVRAVAAEGAPNVPYTLTLKTNGTAGDGAPEYADGGNAVPPAAESRLTVSADTGDEETEETEAEGKKSRTNETDSSLADLPWLAMGLGATGLAIFAGGAAFFLRKFANKG